jgi:cell wall-associated NlpC family hydrolase
LGQLLIKSVYPIFDAACATNRNAAKSKNLMKPKFLAFNIAAILFSFFLLSCGSAKKGNYDTIVLKQDATESVKTVAEPGNNAESKLRTKYAAFLHTTPDSITNLRLYRFIDYWLNTPYLWGGNSKAGIDCSAFMQRLLNDVYSIKIPRTSIQQFFTNNVEPFGSRHYLHEGDLVFFHTTDNEQLVTHVGLYLGNRMFVNASSTYGVSIANMDAPYWKTKYVASGRVIVKK